MNQMAPIAIHLNQLTTPFQTAGWERIDPQRIPFIQQASVAFKQLRSGHPSPKLAVSPDAGGYKKCILDYLQSNKDPAESALFWDIYAVWTLLEILFPLPHATRHSSVVGDLLQWLDLCFPDKNLQQEAEFIVQQVIPQIHPKFWSVVCRLILRGRYGDACKIIRYAGTFQEHTENFEIIERLLVKAPELASFTDTVQFLSRWKLWQAECKAAQEHLKGSDQPKMALILQILTGDPSAILNMATGWLEALVALLLHRQPNATASQINNYLELCESLITDKQTAITTLDQLLMAMIKMDSYLVVRIAASMDAWLVAHITDYLDYCGQLERLDDEVTADMDLREFTVLAYAQMLMSVDVLWPIVADYLMTCPVYGKSQLAAFITRVPLHDTPRFRAVAELCERHNFTHELRTIRRIMAEQSKSRGELGAAIAYSLSAGDAERADSLICSALHKFGTSPSAIKELSTIVSSASEALTNGGDTAAENNNLHFLRSYCRFHALLKSGEEDSLGEAADLLLQFISTNMTPTGMLGPVLLDSLLLLNRETCVLTGDETTEIMRVVEEIDDGDGDCKADDLWIDEQLHLLRFACARNLARVSI